MVYLRSAVIATTTFGVTAGLSSFRGLPTAALFAALTLAAAACIERNRRRYAARDPAAWTLIAAFVFMSGLGFVLEISRTSLERTPSLNVWMADGVVLAAIVLSTAAVARFVAGLDVLGQTGARLRLAIMVCHCLSAVSYQWSRADVMRSGRALPTFAPPAVLGLIAAGAAAILAIAAFRLMMILPTGYILLLVGHSMYSVADVVEPGAVGAGLAFDLAAGCAWSGMALIVCASFETNMASAGARPGVPNPRWSSVSAYTSAIAVSGTLAWRYAGGPLPPDAGVIAVVVLGSCVTALLFQLEHARPIIPHRITTGTRLRRIADDLPVALSLGELNVHYQPIIRLSDGAIAGAEALLRWQHPEFGMLAPLEVLAAARVSGSVAALDAWVAERVLTEGRLLADCLSIDEPYITFNVTPSSLEADFAGTMERVMRDGNLRADGFVIEFTEADNLADPPRAAQQISRLQNIGFLVAIDDFGVGYANLSHLEQFDLDIVKLDRRLLQAALIGRRGESVMQAAVGLSRGLGMIVIAEGVERGADVASLMTWGVHYAQGWAFGRPVPMTELVARARAIG